MTSLLLRQASVIALVFLTACQGGTASDGETDAQLQARFESVDFAHQASDLPVDPEIIYGKLPNGVRYGVRQNATPSNTATLLMRIDTGSLNETDETRGLAHFLEHMAFNGSENMAEGEMTKTLERYGLAFGADTNASTSFDETIYQLELPEVNPELVDVTLGIMRETADRLLLDEDAIERERGIIQAERRARNSPGFEAFIDSLEFYTGHTILPKRIPIGTEATIDSVPPEAFRAFYEGYYRPENTFISFVGDFETEFAVAKIEEAFGDWTPEGEPAEKVQIDSAPLSVSRAQVYSNLEIQTSVELSTFSAYQNRPDVAEYRLQDYISRLGNTILNQRLAKLARTEDAAFIGASVGTYSLFDAGELSQLSISTPPDGWENGLAQAEQTLRQALEFGFTQAELDEQLANNQKALEVSVQTAPTRRTPSLARGILSAFGSHSVVTTPQNALERSVAWEDDGRYTLEAVEAAFRKNWSRIDEAPQLYLSSPNVIEDGEEKLKAALAASRAVPVTPRDIDDAGEFAYTDFGPAGKVVKTDAIADIEATLVEFDNGVRLNMKTTAYEKDRIRLSARIGAGSLAFPTDAPGFRIYADNMLQLGGLEAHKVDDIQTLMAGKSVGVRRGFNEAAMVLSGSTVPSDLDTQLQLMAAYATAPGYRPEAQAQYDKYIRSWYPTLDSTPGGVASRDVGRILRDGDARFGLPDEADLLDVDFERIKAWYAENIDGGAIEITVVGDFDKDTVITAVGKTFGALPKRATDPYDPAASLRDLTFPKATDRPIKLSHAGDAETAALHIYWPAPDGTDVMTTRRLGMLTNMLDLELTEQLREIEGATYSPRTTSWSSRQYPDFGYVGVILEVAPERVDAMAERIKSIASGFASGEMEADAFDRAITPALERLETSLENNGYWMGILSTAQTDDETIKRFRTREEAYRNMTLEDLKPLAKQVFDNSSVVEIQILPEQ